MRFLHRQDDLERERILTLAMRAALTERPDPAIEADLVRRMAETARITQQEADGATHRAVRRLPVRRSRLRLAATFAAAVASFVLALAGLAVAGVALPQPARTVFDKVGIHLPNQTDKAAGDQHAVTGVDTTVPSPGGGPSSESKSSVSAHGTSKAAHERVLQARARRLAEGHGRKLGYTQGKAIGLNGATPPGQTSSRGSGVYSAPGHVGTSNHGSANAGSSHRSSRGTSQQHASGHSGSGAGQGHKGN